MRAKYASSRGSSGIPAPIDAMRDAMKEDRVHAVVGREHLQAAKPTRSRVTRLRSGDVLADFSEETCHVGTPKCRLTRYRRSAARARLQQRLRRQAANLSKDRPGRAGLWHRIRLELRCASASSA